MNVRILFLFLVGIGLTQLVSAEELSGFSKIEKTSLSKKRTEQLAVAVLAFLRLDEKRRHVSPFIDDHLQQAQASLAAGQFADAHELLAVFEGSGIREARFLLYKLYSHSGNPTADESIARQHLEAAAVRNHAEAQRLLTVAALERRDYVDAFLWARISQLYEERNLGLTKKAEHPLGKKEKKRAMLAALRYREQIYENLNALGVAPKDVFLALDESQVTAYLQAVPAEIAQLEQLVRQGPPKTSGGVASAATGAQMMPAQNNLMACTASSSPTGGAGCEPDRLIAAARVAYADGDNARAQALVKTVVRQSKGTRQGVAACHLLEQIEARPIPTSQWTRWNPGLVTLHDCTRQVGWVKARKKRGEVVEIQFRPERKGRTKKYPMSEVVHWGNVLTAADVDWVTWRPGAIIVEGDLREGRVALANSLTKFTNGVLDSYAAKRWSVAWYEAEPGGQVFSFIAKDDEAELVIQEGDNGETVFMNDGRKTCGGPYGCIRHYIQVRSAAEEEEAERKLNRDIGIGNMLGGMAESAKKARTQEKAANAKLERQAAAARRAAVEKADTSRRLAERDAKFAARDAKRVADLQAKKDKLQSEVDALEAAMPEEVAIADPSPTIASSAAASSAATTEDWFQISLSQSGKCLWVVGGETGEVDIVAYPKCSGLRSQLFRIDGSFLRLSHSNGCVGVADNKRTAPVKHYPNCGKERRFFFWLQPSTMLGNDQAYTIRSNLSNGCLAINHETNRLEHHPQCPRVIEDDDWVYHLEYLFRKRAPGFR